MESWTESKSFALKRTFLLIGRLDKMQKFCVKAELCINRKAGQEAKVLRKNGVVY
jgi:hypothetical protein